MMNSFVLNSFMLNSVVLNRPMMLLLLPLAAIFAILYIVRSRKTAVDIENFAGSAERVRAKNGFLERLTLYILVSAVLLIVFALSRPAWNPHPELLQREGRDVVFILDVSNSMLADDIYPNRLERAKMAIWDCVESFDGNRVGLVVFAGSSAIKCPLTLDTDFFHYMLGKVGINSVDQGGTRLSDAIIKTADKLFADSKRGYKDIVLITDGGDQGGGFRKAADVLNGKNVKLIVIGIGDTVNGSKIPTLDETVKYMQYNGRDVVTRLESTKLRELVKLCNAGAYLPVGTKNMHLDLIYRQLNSMKRKELISDNTVTVYDEKFQIFLFLALVLLVIMIVMPLRSRAKFANLAIFFCIFSNSVLYAGSANVAGANDAIEQAIIVKNDYNTTVREYQKAHNADPSPSLFFKLANSCFKRGNYSTALEGYNSAMKEGISKELLVKILYNRGNCYFKLANGASEEEEKLQFLNFSIASYRKVLFQEPKMKDAGFNFELALIEQEKVIEAIKKRDDQNEAMRKALQMIGRKLTALIKAQSDNLVATEDCIKKSKKNDEPRQIILTAEENIEKKSLEVCGDTEEFEEKFFKGIPEALLPMGETLEQLKIAIVNEKQAIKELKIAVNRTSVTAEKNALDALKMALRLLPTEKSSQQGDEDENKSSDDDENSDSESDDASESAQSSTESTVDSKVKELPPPNVSPEDILKRDEEIQKKREGNGVGKKRKPVEKDW